MYSPVAQRPPAMRRMEGVAQEPERRGTRYPHPALSRQGNARSTNLRTGHAYLRCMASRCIILHCDATYSIEPRSIPFRCAALR